MNAVALAAEAVPERYYTHHAGRGPTPHRSNPAVIHRELATLDVRPGHRVAECGTGSGYSGGLLSHLVGPEGHVVSLDIDEYLTRWAGVIHRERGAANVRCHAADGTAGFPGHTPYDRMVAWCTPPLLPQTWVDQVTEGGLIVAPLPIAEVPGMTVVAKVRVTGSGPVVEAVFTGGYIEATASPKENLDLPGRWVDWENRFPTPSWISVAWRGIDDRLHTGARAALNLLLKSPHAERCDGPGVDWQSWRTFVAALDDPHLTMAGLRPDLRAAGHSTPESAAVLQQDGTILADGPGSPSLVALRGWLTAWDEAGRPAPDAYSASLVRAAPGTAPAGWLLRLRR